MHKKIEGYIEQSDRFADYIIDELTKIPPNWDQAYEYIEMIGSQMSEAVNAAYEITKDEKLREEYISYIEKESDRIKKRIVSTIRSVCK